MAGETERARRKKLIEREGIRNLLEDNKWFKEQSKEKQELLLKTLVGDVNESDDTLNLGVALFNRRGAVKLLEDMTDVLIPKEMITQYQVPRGQARFEENQEIKKGYNKLNESGFFTSFLNPEGKEQISLAYDQQFGYQVHHTRKQLGSAISNAGTNGFIAFDIETTGGKILGTKNIGKHITEFSAKRIGLIEDGELTQLDYNPDHIFSYDAVIGANEEEVEEYNKLLDKFKKGTGTRYHGLYTTEGMSAEEMVTLKRLAKMGHRNTELVRDDKSKNYHFSRFASSEDIYVLNINDIEEGIHRLQQVWKDQEKDTVDFDGHDVKPWEHEILSFLKDLHKNKLTLVGHKSRDFDLPEINRLLNSDKTSSAFKKAAREILGISPEQGIYLEVENHLDTLSVARQFLTNLKEPFYSHDDLRQMEKLGLTENTLEAIVRRLTADTDEKTGRRDWSKTYYEKQGASHKGLVDVGADVEFVKQLILGEAEEGTLSGIVRKSIAEFTSQNNKESKVFEDGLRQGHVLFSKQHFDPSSYDLLLFKKDELTGAIRTSDEISINEEGNVVKQIFPQTGMQKGLAYRVKSIYELPTNEEYHKIMKDMYPTLDIGKLSAIELEVYDFTGENKIPAKYLGSSIYVGDKEKIAQAMIDNTYLLGSTDKNGRIDPASVPMSTVNALQKVTVKLKEDSQGKIQIGFEDSVKKYNPVISRADQKNKEKTEQSQQVLDDVADNQKTRMRESAARLNREHNAKKDAKLLELWKVLDKEARDAADKIYAQSVGEQPNIEVLREQEFSRIQAEFFENSVNISKAIVQGSYKAGGFVTKDNSIDYEAYNEAFARSYNKYLGYSYDGKNGRLYVETLTSQLERLDFIAKNHDLVEKVLKAARFEKDDNSLTWEGQEFSQYHYQSIWHELEEYVRAKSDVKNPEVLGYKNEGMFAYEFDRRFDLDISGFMGKLPNESIVTLNLESRPENIANTIIRSNKDIFPSLEDFSEPEKTVLLYDLQRFLHNKGQGSLKNLSAESAIQETMPTQ